MIYQRWTKTYSVLVGIIWTYALGFRVLVPCTTCTASFMTKLTGVIRKYFDQRGSLTQLLRSWLVLSALLPLELVKEHAALNQFSVLVSFGHHFFFIGRRMCIAETFTMDAAFAYITTLLRKFTIERVPGEGPLDLRTKGSLTLSPMPFNILLKLRE